MHMIKKLKRTIVFILKIALFASLFGIFFGIFGINNPWLFNFSRTTGVTMVTFVVLGIRGSALGPIAIQQALNHLNYNELPAEKRGGPRLYVEDNIDPERIKNDLVVGHYTNKDGKLVVGRVEPREGEPNWGTVESRICLLYTSDAADE